MVGMRQWIMRNLVCRFRGHADGVRMPLFMPWYGYGGKEVGSVHCKRCGQMIGDY